MLIVFCDIIQSICDTSEAARKQAANHLVEEFCKGKPSSQHPQPARCTEAKGKVFVM
jgi:hypothetical protein